MRAALATLTAAQAGREEFTKTAPLILAPVIGDGSDPLRSALVFVDYLWHLTNFATIAGDELEQARDEPGAFAEFLRGAARALEDWPTVEAMN